MNANNSHFGSEIFCQRKSVSNALLVNGLLDLSDPDLAWSHSRDHRKQVNNYKIIELWKCLKCSKQSMWVLAVIISNWKKIRLATPSAERNKRFQATTNVTRAIIVINIITPLFVTFTSLPQSAPDSRSYTPCKSHSKSALLQGPLSQWSCLLALRGWDLSPRVQL